MSIGEIMLSEKTRVALNIGTFLLLIGYIIIGTWAVARFTARVDAIEKQVAENTACIIDDKVVQQENQIRLTAIETNTLWIMAKLEEMKQ